MTFRKLIWEQLDGTFGKDFFAEIKGFDNRYYIYIERNTGKTIGIDLFRKKQEFNTIKDAKDFYEKDFENKMIDLLALTDEL